MKRFSLLGIGALAAIGLAVLNPVVKADEHDRKTVISISQSLEVPGAVLPPGTYVMKLFNSSSDRHIVQFMNERQNQQLALTFAIPAERARPAEKTLLTMYEGSGGAPPAIRTWYYPGDNVGQEFLYPHDQASRISKRTNVAVPEVEIASSSAAAPSPAEPTESNVQNNETRDEPVLVARAEPAPEPTPEPVAEPVAAPEPQQPAESQAPPANSAQSSQESAPPAATESLPQTAGNGPLAALIGSLAFAFALGLRRLKRSRIL